MRNLAIVSDMTTTATTKQVSYYNALLDQIATRGDADEFDPTVIALCRENFPLFTTSAASEAIGRAMRTVDALKLRASERATAERIASAATSERDNERKASESVRASATRPTVANGRYALVAGDGVKFYRVNTPDSGKWSGYTFVSALASDDEHAIRNRDARSAILAAIVADPDSLARYGREIGACGICNRTLTDDESRARGIGPVCYARL